MGCPTGTFGDQSQSNGSSKVFVRGASIRDARVDGCRWVSTSRGDPRGASMIAVIAVIVCRGTILTGSRKRALLTRCTHLGIGQRERARARADHRVRACAVAHERAPALVRRPAFVAPRRASFLALAERSQARVADADPLIPMPLEEDVLAAAEHAQRPIAMAHARGAVRSSSSSSAHSSSIPRVARSQSSQ